MTDAEFDAYHATALDELQSKQNRLAIEYGLGKHDRFFVDYETEKIQFSDQGKVVVEASFIAVGSHVSEKNSWKWAWANESLPAAEREKSSAIKQLYEMTGYDVFRNENANVDDDMAWGFLALTCKLLGCLGGYTAVNKNIRVYLAIKSIANVESKVLPA